MAQFRFGNFDFPDKFIKWDGYDISPNQRQDLDSYTDGYGETRRTTLKHTKTGIEFTTLSMSGSDFRMIMDGITSNYKSYEERNADCTYYDDETGAFKTGKFYLDPSIKFRHKKVDANGIPTKYGEIQWIFIEY